MTGMNFGAGTGSVNNSPMTKPKDKVKEGPGERDVKFKSDVPEHMKPKKKTPPTSPLTKPGDRAEKLKAQAEKIKGKKKDILYKEDGSLRTDALSKRESKRHQRLSEKQMRKTAKANRKEQIQKNIDAGAKTRKEKRANTQKFRQGNLGNTTQTMVKSFDSEGEKRKTTTTERGGNKSGTVDASTKVLDKNKKTGVKTKTDTRNPEGDYQRQKNRGTGNPKKSSSSSEGSFGDAFKGARKSGKATFDYKGKSYHTRQADETKESYKKKHNTTADSPGAEPKKK